MEYRERLAEREKEFWELKEAFKDLKKEVLVLNSII